MDFPGTEEALPLKAVFCDIDGTLVDSNEFHVMAWDEAFHRNGFVTGKDAIRGQIGKGADQLIPALFQQMDKCQYDAISRQHGEIFGTRYLGQVRAFPHATDLIHLLHAKGVDVILASSADKADVKYYTGLLNLSAVLKGAVTNDDVQKSKPAGDIFAAALAQVFPVTAPETLAIGDTPYDVESALRSDVRTIALRSGGFSQQALSDAGAAYVFSSVKELFDDFQNTPLAW